ncbi:isoprenylcysteine carboxylmethyltransferase family protein [candidate division KSB1 bacterium]|nr:isoprenylcysteine carboxylmethyltransferase family protein [candidate division KSB1 bacterium]
MDIREKIFNYRSYTPIPLAIAVLILAKPTLYSFLGGLFLVIIGELTRIWGVGYAGGATRTTSGVGGDVLIISGAFAHVRNPLYLGNFLLSLGLCIMAWPWMPWMLLIYLLFFGIQYGLIISKEEEHLRGKFGSHYEDYSKNVPRLIPRLTAYKKASPEQTFNLMRALRSERTTLINTILFIGLIGLLWYFN